MWTEYDEKLILKAEALLDRENSEKVNVFGVNQQLELQKEAERSSSVKRFNLEDRYLEETGGNGRELPRLIPFREMYEDLGDFLQK